MDEHGLTVGLALVEEDVKSEADENEADENSKPMASIAKANSEVFDTDMSLEEAGEISTDTFKDTYDMHEFNTKVNAEDKVRSTRRSDEKPVLFEEVAEDIHEEIVIEEMIQRNECEIFDGETGESKQDSILDIFGDSCLGDTIAVTDTVFGYGQSCRYLSSGI